MTNVEGWLFMHLVKKVRLHTNKKTFHRDSGIDGMAYDSLEVEEWAKTFAEENKDEVQLPDATNIERSSGYDARPEKPLEEDDIYDLGLR